MSNVKANTKKPKRDKYTWLGSLQGFTILLNKTLYISRPKG